MNRRFFCETPITGDDATLADSEAHHLLHVLRAEVGDQVVLFDGSGQEFQAEVATLSRREVGLKIVDVQSVDRESRRNVTIAVALPKGDRQKTLIEKCVELGVTNIVPLTTERSVAKPKPSAIKKLQRAVIEASKQCGRNRLMQISEAQSFSSFVSEQDSGAVRILAHPYQAVRWESASGDGTLELTADQPVIAAIGPEGGFSEGEFAMAVECGWTAVELGPRILRIETAAIAFATRLVN